MKRLLPVNAPVYWIATLVVTLAIAATSRAAPVEVNNHSFENASYTGTQSWTNDLVDPGTPGEPQWNGRDDNNSGQTFIEKIGGFFADGQAHIGMELDYYVFQDTGVPWEANTTYTLRVAVGNRNADFTQTGNVSVIGLSNDPDKVGVGIDPLPTTESQLESDPLLAEAHTTLDAFTIPVSSFQDVELIYETGDTPPTGTIVIFLGNNSLTARAHFDNIRLDAIGSDDADGDGLPTEWEVANGLDPNDATGDNGADGDPDLDGSSNMEEFERVTDPQNPDTDGDGALDGAETLTGVYVSADDIGTDPLNADTDGDTISDGAEVTSDPPTNPNLADTDGDEFEDQAEIAFGTDPSVATDFPVDNGALNLGLNFVGGRVNGILGADVTGTAGVVPQDNWNNLETLAASGQALIKGDGSDAIMRIDWTADAIFTISDADPPGGISQDTALMAGYLKTRIGVLTEVTVRNIPYPRYDVYVYADAAGTTGVTEYEVNGREVLGVLDNDDWPIDGGGGTYTEIQGDGSSGNYLVFRNVQGPTMTLNARIPAGMPDNLGPINAIQIVRAEPGEPSLYPDPAQVNFGTFLGDPGVISESIEIINTGSTETLNITSSSITGDAADRYSISALPASLAPGESIPVTITFSSPGDTGTYRAVLEIESNAEDVPITRIELTTQLQNPNRLLAHYNMDETEGTTMTDSSGNGYHGTYVEEGGSITLGEPGLAAGTAVRFSKAGGTAAGVIPEDVPLPPLNVASYAFWLQADAGDETPSGVFGQGTTPGQPFGIAFVPAGGATSLQWSSSTALSMESTPFLEGGETYHILFTYSDPSGAGTARLRLYVDGELLDEEESTAGFDPEEGGPFQIGSVASTLGLNGVIDDFQIYERELTAEDASFLFANPGATAEPPPPTLPIGYWSFDDQANPTSDASPEGNNADLSGDPAFVAGHSGAAGDFAISFDGVDDFATSGVPLLDNLDVFTMAGWVNFTAEQPARTGLFGQNDLVEFGMISATSMEAWTSSEGAISAAFGPDSGGWAHVAYVAGATLRRIYINGEEVASGGVVHPRGTTAFNFNIGGGGVQDAEGNFFNGIIDDVAVWDVELDPSQITALASRTANPINLFSGGNPGGGGGGDSGIVVTATWTASGGLALEWSSEDGVSFDVEYSETMSSWEVIAADVVSAGGMASFTDEDPERTARPTGFYRVAVPVADEE